MVLQFNSSASLMHSNLDKSDNTRPNFLLYISQQFHIHKASTPT